MTEQQSTFEYTKIRMLSQYLSRPFPALPGRAHTREFQATNLGLPLDWVATVYCFVCDENAARMDYEPSTWRRLARAVHDKQLPGGHNICVTTFAGVVANELQGIFAGRNSGRRMR